MLLCIICFWPIFLTNYYFAKFSMLSCPTNSIKLAHKYLFMQTFSLSICYEPFFRAVFSYYIYRYMVKNKSARKNCADLLWLSKISCLYFSRRKMMCSRIITVITPITKPLPINGLRMGGMAAIGTMQNSSATIMGRPTIRALLNESVDFSAVSILRAAASCVPIR